MPTRPKVDLSKVPDEHLQEAQRLLAQWEATVAANPLEVFEPHGWQKAFLEAREPIVAAFCGNRAGKTSIMVVKALTELLSASDVPEHLAHNKQREAPVHGWFVCPTEDKVFDSILPAIRKWCPPHAILGGKWNKAFNGERMMLTFANGSTLGMKTYRQDANTLGGASLDFVGYDEPPPRNHYDECMTRLIDRGGPQWFAMTPLTSNTGWIRREIWRKRAAPHIMVVKGSMHDNPTLDKRAVARTLAGYKNDIWRRAREFGDFMDVAGQVYADFERCVVDPLPVSWVRANLHHVVGIDPGIRNAAVIFGGFDRNGVDWIYDEALIQNGTPSQYAQVIDRKLAQWGLRRTDVMFVIDPAARQRSQATGDTVQSELARVGIFTINGTNDREAGQQQIRDRILHRRIQIFSTCLGLRDDADEFAWEMDEDDFASGAADDAPFHRLATLRYQVMVRPFYPQREADAPLALLGASPNTAPDMRLWRPESESLPMGTMM